MAPIDEVQDPVADGSDVVSDVPVSEEAPVEEKPADVPTEEEKAE